jgi:hypothetical protein
LNTCISASPSHPTFDASCSKPQRKGWGVDYCAIIVSKTTRNRIHVHEDNSKPGYRSFACYNVEWLNVSIYLIHPDSHFYYEVRAYTSDVLATISRTNYTKSHAGHQSSLHPYTQPYGKTNSLHEVYTPHSTTVIAYFSTSWSVLALPFTYRYRVIVRWI